MSSHSQYPPTYTRTHTHTRTHTRGAPCLARVVGPSAEEVHLQRRVTRGLFVRQRHSALRARAPRQPSNAEVCPIFALVDTTHTHTHTHTHTRYQFPLFVAVESLLLGGLYSCEEERAHFVFFCSVVSGDEWVVVQCMLSRLPPHDVQTYLYPQVSSWTTPDKLQSRVSLRAKQPNASLHYDAT